MAFKLLCVLLGLVIFVASDEIIEQQDETSLEPELHRVRRQGSGPGHDAMEAFRRTMTRGPVGQFDFSRPTLRNPYFDNMKNFGGRVGGSAGVKVWESGAKRAGVGLAGEANVGLVRGRPFANTPAVGAAAGFQNGPFSASVGGSHQSGGPTKYGAVVRYDKGAFSGTAGIGHQRHGPTEAKVGVEYRFKRSASDLESEESLEDIDPLTEGREEPERKKRQVTNDAMQRSLTNYPVGKPDFGRPTLQGGYFHDMKNFGGRVGGSAGVKVWESGRSSVGLGAAGAANAGLARGRPYVNGQEVGAGIGYQRGPFSATFGVGRQHRGPTTYGLGMNYRFKRSAPEYESVETEDDVDDATVEDVEEPTREKRQVTTDAMQRSLTNNPVGKPEFGRPSLQGGYFQDVKNFGGRVGGSAGVKVWESGRNSVGLGAAGAANVGLTGGRPYANSPEVGAGIGYRRGQFGASVGVGHGFQGRGSTTYGAGLSYRFRRSIEDKDSSEPDKESEEDVEELQESKQPEETAHALNKRQISDTASRAMDKSLTNFPIGRLGHSKGVDNPHFQNPRNFGGRATGSVGTKVWEKNNRSVGVGLAADSNIGLSNGRPFATPPRAGVGVGYRQGPFSATVGMDRGRRFGGRYTNNYGVRFSYDFPRGKREISEMQDEE